MGVEGGHIAVGRDTIQEQHARAIADQALTEIDTRKLLFEPLSVSNSEELPVETSIYKDPAMASPPRRLAPGGKIVVSTDPSASLHKEANSNVAPAAENHVSHPVKDDDENAKDHGEEPPEVPSAIADVPEPPPSLRLAPISPGLSNVRLPLGLASKVAAAESTPEPNAQEKPAEAKVGDIVETSFGRGQVRKVREDGMLEIEAMGWELSGEQRARYVFRHDAVTVVPTVYYRMSILERLQISLWLKVEGTRLFKESNFEGAVERYMKAIGVLKTAEFKTNAQNARALEIMIPCHNNAATCYIKLKNYKDAGLLAENVDTLCGALERNRGGLVMKALKARGVAEIKVLGQWWCKGLFLGGKAFLYQGENEQAVACLKKASKIAKPASLAKLRADIVSQLELATKRLSSQKAKAQKMWNKAFKKNSSETQREASAEINRELPSTTGTTKSDALQKLQNLVQKGTISTDERVVENGGHDDDDEEEEEEYGDDEAVASQWWLGTALTVGAIAALSGLIIWSRRR